MAEAEAEVTQAEADAPRSLARSSLVMVGGSFASRALGVVRAGLLTAIIGTLAAGDAFNLANTLPNVFYILAAGGILIWAISTPFRWLSINSSSGCHTTHDHCTLTVITPRL